MELRLGSELSGYTVVRRLGGGGMGVVYLVRHRERGTLHAVKLLRYVDPRMAVRLRAEGRLQATLDHPNIVRVTGVIEVRGQPGLVMDYIAGPTLAALLARTGGLTVPEADALGRRLLRAVSAAHAAGWVHRDLKPENVLLDIDGDRIEPRVTDFGLATASDAAAERGTLTRLGAGTRRYMSLEQVTGGPPEPGMDVFALGALLFELVEGVPAFPTVQGWREALESGRYPVPCRPDVPERMRDTVLAALADRRHRDPDAGSLLRRWEAGTPEPVGPFRAETLDLAVTATAHPTFAADAGDGVWCASRIDEDAWGGPVLPTERDEFVGRSADLRALAELADGRLVTIHGPGGIGKTRIAVRFARQSSDAWPGGVWSCDLSGARDVDGIVRAVARTLGVALDGSDPVLQLGHAIAGRRRCLVVLDNFEQVAGYADATVGVWTGLAPEATLLATSRIVLGIPGERILRLEPLARDDAMALFVDRARAANQAFDPTLHAGAIERLVSLLDGLPLAIELCAARVRILPPARIVERMDDRFKVLSGGQGRADRHATLRAALDGSWDLLRDWERAALAQCTVFAGRFGLDAAEHVLDVSTFPAAPWPIDILQALVDESLVRAVGDGSFELLQSIRDYAAERLGAEAPAVRMRHAAWYAALADDAETRDRRLLGDLDNLVAAARAALEAGDGDLAARAAVGAARILEFRGPYRSAWALLGEVRDRASLSPLMTARLLAALGRAAHALVRWDEARSCFDQALATFRALGEGLHEGQTLSAIGAMEWERGNRTESERAMLAALDVHRRRGDRSRIGRALNGLASLEVAVGRADAGLPLYEEALALARECGARIDEGIVLANLAQLFVAKGRHRDALGVLESALAIHRETGDRKHEARALTSLGNLCQLCRDLDGARTYLEAATVVYREIGDRRSEGVVLCSIGPLRILEGRLAEAETVLGDALRLNRETGHRRIEATVLGNLALIYGRTGRRAEALEHFAAGVSLHRELDNPRGEGILLGRLAEYHLTEGDLGRAKSATAEADQLLRAAGDPHQLGVVVCLRALVCSAGGDVAGAGAAMEEAEALARDSHADPASTFGEFLARARASVGAR